jgi:hypothetical protein
MPRKARDLPAPVRREVSTLLLRYSERMTEAQRDLVEGRHVKCADELLAAAEALAKAARILSKGG